MLFVLVGEVGDPSEGVMIELSNVFSPSWVNGMAKFHVAEMC